MSTWPVVILCLIVAAAALAGVWLGAFLAQQLANGRDVSAPLRQSPKIDPEDLGDLDEAVPATKRTRWGTIKGQKLEGGDS